MDFSRNIEQMADLELTVRYEDIEDGWVTATVLEFPEVITQGANQAEARENVLDALRLVLSVRADEASQAGGTTEHLAFALAS